MTLSHARTIRQQQESNGSLLSKNILFYSTSRTGLGQYNDRGCNLHPMLWCSSRTWCSYFKNQIVISGQMDRRFSQGKIYIHFQFHFRSVTWGWFTF